MFAVTCRSGFDWAATQRRRRGLGASGRGGPALPRGAGAPAGSGALRRRVLRRVPALRPAGARPRPDGRGRAHRHPRRRVRVVDVGARGRALRARMARSRCSTAPTRAASRSSSARRPTRCRRGWCASTRRSRPSAAPGGAIPYGHRQDGDYRPPGVPLARGADHAQGRRPLRRPPGGDRLPGRQRARHGAVPQPRRLRGLRRQAARRATATSRRSTSEWGLVVLVAPDRALGRAVAAGRQHRALLRPRVAPLPVGAHDGLHRRAGRRSCASSPGRISSSRPAWRSARPAFDPPTSTAASTSPRSTRTTRCRTR